jgi:hypothetical protein
MPWVADLSDGESIQRRVQDRRHLGGDFDSAAREADDDDAPNRRLESAGVLELTREQPSSFAPVFEARDLPLPISRQRLHTSMIDLGAQFGIRGTPDKRLAEPPPEQGRLDLTKKTSVGAPPV